MKRSSLVFLVTIFAFSGSLWARQDLNSEILSCSEGSLSESLGGGENLGLIQAQFNADGQIVRLTIDRQASDGFEPMKTVYDQMSSKFTHSMVQNPVDEDGNPTNNAYGILEVEHIVVLQNGQEVFRLRVNDHAYAGNPGSSMRYLVGQKVLDTETVGHMVECDGRVMRPWNTGLDEIE